MSLPMSVVLVTVFKNVTVFLQKAAFVFINLTSRIRCYPYLRVSCMTSLRLVNFCLYFLWELELKALLSAVLFFGEKGIF